MSLLLALETPFLVSKSGIGSASDGTSEESMVKSGTLGGADIKHCSQMSKHV